MSATARPSKICQRSGDVAPLKRDTEAVGGNYRNRDLLDLAHALHDCTLQIPGVCTGHSIEGLEPAHSNQAIHGKGAHIKAHDCFHAAACHACHAAIDQGSKLTREERQHFWLRGFERTLLAYWLRGWLKVAG